MTFILGRCGGEKSSPVAFPIPSEELGSVSISPSGSFEAGSYQTFTLVYTAGKFGIDDSGSMRICFRFASDQTRPQFEIQQDQIIQPLLLQIMPS